jgi:hypothetical protein
MIPKRQEMDGRPTGGLRRILAIGMLLTIVLSGCGTSTSTPQPAQPAGSGWDVACRRLEVQASIGQLSPLVQMELNQQDRLVDGGYVWTGYDGEARLTWSDCITVYTFYQTSIVASEGTVVADCVQEDWGDDCIASTTINENDCTVNVVTLPADVTLSGTWVTIMYMKEYQLTLVIAHEGTATVTPRMKEADSTPDATQKFAVTGGNFAYTVPEEYRDKVAEVLDITKYPPRGVFPVSEIAPLARALVLVPRLQAVNERLIEFSVPNQIPQDVLNIQEIVVYGGGPDLDKTSVQEAVQLGVDWNRLGLETIPDRDVLFHARFGSAVGFTPLTVFDPERSKALLEEAGYGPGILVTVILDKNLPGSDGMQELLKSQLAEVGFEVREFVVTDSASGSDLYQDNLAAGDNRVNMLFVTSH